MRDPGNEVVKIIPYYDRKTPKEIIINQTGTRMEKIEMDYERWTRLQFSRCAFMT